MSRCEKCMFGDEDVKRCAQSALLFSPLPKSDNADEDKHVVSFFLAVCVSMRVIVSHWRLQASSLGIPLLTGISGLTYFYIQVGAASEKPRCSTLPLSDKHTPTPTLHPSSHRALIHTRARPHTRTHPHARTHICTHTNTHAHEHTNAHAHTKRGR